MTKATWRQAIAQPHTKDLARGCYQTSYPSLQWQATTCRTAPEVPFEPAAGSTPRTATVGDDTDYSAEVTGTISSATGSFDDVSPTITETGQVDDQGAQIANSFTLQLNSEFFSNSPACSGSADPSNCEGWQQFIYEDDPSNNDVFMQYWLINYDATCPSGWYSYYSDCYTNSPASSYPGSALTAADLAMTQLTGSASAGGNDEVALSFGGEATLAINADSIVGLAPNWNTSQFDVFGDGGGGQANFGADTTLEAQTTLSDNSLSAPTCVEEGFTGETNNLSLTNTPTIGTQALPTIVSEQTNVSPTTPSCAASPGSATPTTSVLIPANSASVSGTTTLDAAATKATGVGFYLFGGSYYGLLVGSATPTQYGWVYEWNTTTVPNGSYELFSKATGSGGSAVSSGVDITVSNPITSILIPANGASVSGTTTLDAAATNATGVGFYLFGGSYYGLLVGSATPTEYGWISKWNTTLVPNGSYELFSKAAGSGSSAVSSGVSITVKN